MNKLTVWILFIFYTWIQGSAQVTCDIITNGISSSQGFLRVGDSTLATFDIFNDAGGDNCFYSVNSILVVLSFPDEGLAYNNIISPAMGPFFLWNYDPVERILYGLNHLPLYDGNGETVVLSVIAQSIPSNLYPACRMLEVEIFQNPVGPLFPSNVPANDSGFTTMTIAPANQYAVVECLDEAVPPVIAFNTTCTPANPVPVVTDVPDMNNCEIERMYLYNFIDCNGCPVDTFDWAFVYTVSDSTSPVWTTDVGALDTTLSCSDVVGLMAAQALFPVAYDNCDNSVTNIVKSSGTFVAGISCPQAGTYTNTWTVMDECGNVSSVYTQVITIIDTLDPAWTTAIGALDTTLSCSDVSGLTAAQAMFPGASDNCDTDVSNIVKTSGSFVQGISCPQAGTYSNTWTVTDACGNISVTYTQVITIIDTTGPVITINGISPVEVCLHDVYVDAGATATDVCDMSLSSVNVNNPVNTSMPGTYMVTYSTSDACGNLRSSSRTVIVRQQPTGTISGTTTVVQNNMTFSNVFFTGTNGTAPYTFTFRLNGGSIQTIVSASNNDVVILSHSNANVGVFEYELLSVTDAFGCQGLLTPHPDPVAIITVIQGCDLSPSIPRPISGSFVTSQTREGFIQFTNAGPGPTSGTLELRISPISNFSLLIPPTMVTADGFSVQNSSPLVTIVPGTFFTTLFYNGTINAGSNIRIGYILTAMALGGSNGNLTITVLNSTGGDGNNNNNRAVRTFVIN